MGIDRHARKRLHVGPKKVEKKFPSPSLGQTPPCRSVGLLAYSSQIRPRPLTRGPAWMIAGGRPAGSRQGRGGNCVCLTAIDPQAWSPFKMTPDQPAHHPWNMPARRHKLPPHRLSQAAYDYFSSGRRRSGTSVPDSGSHHHRLPVCCRQGADPSDSSSLVVTFQ